VKKRDANVLVRRCERLVVISFERGRSELKKRSGEVIRQNMAHLQLTENMTLNKKLWWTRIRVVG